ncbi:MAG TPA: TlpA disulfide reductase family protein [Longimicrobiales bacterium]|nr:TlpA disulfide reductase family protein [Longimicrobiales bacterium]
MTERTERWLIRGSVLVLFLTLLSLAWVNRATYAPLDTGAPAPDFSYPTLAGDTISLSGLRGQVVLLNIWATWCPPCVREMPSMQRLHELLGEEGLRIVAVSVDAPGALGDVRSFVHEYGLEFEILLNPGGGIQDTYAVTGLPTTFLIDRDGRIRRKVLGGTDWMAPDNVKSVHALLE